MHHLVWHCLNKLIVQVFFAGLSFSLCFELCNKLCASTMNSSFREYKDVLCRRLIFNALLPSRPWDQNNSVLDLHWIFCQDDEITKLCYFHSLNLVVPHNKDTFLYQCWQKYLNIYSYSQIGRSLRSSFTSRF